MATGSALAARRFQVVVAATRAMGIGREGGLPWKLSGDMAYFKALTKATKAGSKRNAVVMGRKTWESIPPKFRPLPGRLNVVLSASGAVAEAGEEENASGNVAGAGAVLPAGTRVERSLEAALQTLASPELADEIESVFVIGGAQVYTEAVSSPLCDAVHLTEVNAEAECDAFFPELDPSVFRLWSASPPRTEKGCGTRYAFTTYVRAGEDGRFRRPPARPAAPSAPTHEEHQYLGLIREILDHGVSRGDRTGTGTVSVFGRQMRFDLRRGRLPLLTTKRVFWRGLAEELLWFVKGETNAKLLHDKGIGIWDGNASRAYLDSIGLADREEWDLGPVYGFQWRHFGAEYEGMHADYAGKGVDQLAEVIHKIKNNPNDRRIIMSAWNPADLKEMALPPCHMFCQFYVAEGELSCQMYQRSCDMGLGVPFNIASYSLLTYMVAHCCGLRPGEFVHVLGDAHVYSNHVEPLERQLQMEPRPFPTLRINTDNTDIDGFKLEDFELVGYDPHPKIEMQMAV